MSNSTVLHKEILTKEQIKLLPFLTKFSRDFGLVGGTAVALHLGHRRSLDFNLFSSKKFGNQAILNRILEFQQFDKIIVNKLDELTLEIAGIKFTFFRYPFEVDYGRDFEGIIKMPDLLTLAAMKAFALGMRAKWKDYVDLYFIIKNHLSISEIAQKGDLIFSHRFNEKLFRSQLGYFEGIDYQEAIEFLPGFDVSEEQIKKELTEFSIKLS